MQLYSDYLNMLVHRNKIDEYDYESFFTKENIIKNKTVIEEISSLFNQTESLAQHTSELIQHLAKLTNINNTE